MRRSAAAQSPLHAVPKPSAPRRAWTDRRTVLGIGLIAGSAAIGYLTLPAPETQTAWVAERTVPVGQTIAPGDLERVEVSIGAAGDGYVLDDGGVGATARRTLHPGELVPAAALGPGDTGGRRIAVPLGPGQRPAGLTAGSLVDVWVTDEREADAQLVLSGATVVDQESGDDLGGSGVVTLALTAEQAERVGAVLGAAGQDRLAVSLVGGVPATAEVG